IMLQCCVLTFITFRNSRNHFHRATEPVADTRRVAPYMVAIVVAVMVLSFIYKVLQNRFDAPPVFMSLVIAIVTGSLVGLAVRQIIRNRDPRPGTTPYAYVERMFAMLQISTACFVAFAHGANDVANAIGPVAAVVELYRTGYTIIATEVSVPFWVLVAGGAGIVIGLSTYGYRVIATIGGQITEMTPTRGFSAEFGAATTVLVASSLGLPISTTHTLVGGVIGVGFAQGIAALNLAMIRNIVNSWLATVPVSAGVAALVYTLARVSVL